MTAISGLSRAMLRVPTLALLLFAVTIVTGCASTRKPTHVVRLAVLDGVMVGEAAETRTVVTGWWMLSRDRFENGNAGIQLGEVLAREYQKIPGVQVLSRTDLSSYMAQKERLIRRTYPDLTPMERLVLLQEQSPLDYGKSLNVDFVLASRLSRARTTHNRTIHWWVSRVAFELELWNVNTGEMVWSWARKDSDLYSSQLEIMEESARKSRKRAQKKDVFGLYP